MEPRRGPVKHMSVLTEDKEGGRGLTLTAAV
jgi:hypothetical protein